MLPPDVRAGLLAHEHDVAVLHDLPPAEVAQQRLQLLVVQVPALVPAAASPHRPQQDARARRDTRVPESGNALLVARMEGSEAGGLRPRMTLRRRFTARQPAARAGGRPGCALIVFFHDVLDLLLSFGVRLPISAGATTRTAHNPTARHPRRIRTVSTPATTAGLFGATAGPITRTNRHGKVGCWTRDSAQVRHTRWPSSGREVLGRHRCGDEAASDWLAPRQGAQEATGTMRAVW